MIEQAFFESLKTFQVPEDQINILWQQVEKKYTSPKRYYHNLTHLNNFLIELKPVKSQFKNWEIVVPAIALHDIIYNPLKNNNEEKSATLAVKELAKLGLPNDLIQYCSELILATKKHESTQQEIKLFTDADLAILGAKADDYLLYTQQIRREYNIYPDILFYSGRKKVLQHFLNRDKIYLSDYFHERYEQKAITNLETELISLS